MDALRLPEKLELSTLLVPSLSLAGAYALFLAARFLVNGSPVRHIPGPPKSSWFMGNLRDIRADAEDGVLLEKWVETYGHVFTFSAVLNVSPPYSSLLHVLSIRLFRPPPDASRPHD
jgi:hypothetical protein